MSTVADDLTAQWTCFYCGEEQVAADHAEAINCVECGSLLVWYLDRD